jgi:alpha-tubulin suppressor-like RCC1 family protein
VGGRLGLEGDVQTSPASPVHGGYQFREVEMGAWYACGIEATLQVVKCWGSNASGVLGDSTITDSPLPHVVDAPTTFLDLSVGPRHACAVAADRTVWCWGSNGSGQIGNGSTDPVVPNPVQVPGVSDAVVVEVGAEFSCATELTGVLRCWGANDQGQLGIDVNLPHAPPTPANLVGNAGPVAAGAKHTCAPAGNGVLHCWGNGLLGQLGHLAPAISFHPLAVLIPAGSPLPDPAARAASVFRIPLRPSRTQPGAGR